MYRKRNSELLRHLDFEAVDFLIIAFLYLFWNRFFHFSESLGVYYNDLQTILILLFVNIVLLIIIHPYKDIIQRGYWLEFLNVVHYCTSLYAFSILLMYVLGLPITINNSCILILWASSVVAIWIWRILRKRAIRKYSLGTYRRRTVLISNLENIQSAYDQLNRKTYSPVDITAIILTDVTSEEESILPENAFKDHVTIIYGLDENCEYLRQEVVDDVFIACYNSSQEWKKLVQHFLNMGLVVHIGLLDYNFDYSNSTINHFGNIYALTTSFGSADSWQLTLKRAMDIVGALVGLFLTGIVSIFVVPAIKIADPGPALFKQKRVGKNGRVFDFYKFRSMYMDAEQRKKELMEDNQMQGLMFKMENDPRIIGSEKGPGKGIGNFIRKTSIDELPQFWNILKGDMSLVGTRPPTLDEYEQYDPHHKIRLSMKPGLTGMWQVNGRNEITDFDEVVNLDSTYIENWNLGMDIKILLKTVAIVFKMVGAK